MPVLVDMVSYRYEDAVLTVGLAPPVAIGGWNIRYQVSHRFGGSSGLITKSAASGYGGGVSGITVTNSGQGIFNIAINGADTSGLEYGNYAYAIERLDSGNRSVLSEGHLQLLQGIG